MKRLGIFALLLVALAGSLGCEAMWNGAVNTFPPDTADKVDQARLESEEKERLRLQMNGPDDENYKRRHGL